MNTDSMNVRYIQRLLLPSEKLTNPYVFGCGLRNGGISDQDMTKISKLASFDYMGAAQYESGKLSQALSDMARTHNQKDPLALKCIKLISKKVWVLANESNLSEAIKVVKRLGTTKKMDWKLKCPSLFPSVLKEQSKTQINGWIDIENNYMFFVDETMASGFLNFLSSKFIPTGFSIGQDFKLLSEN